MRPATALLLASTMLAATPAFAQTAAPAADAAPDEATIVVFGRGETRQVQEIKAHLIMVKVEVVVHQKQEMLELPQVQHKEVQVVLVRMF